MRITGRQPIDHAASAFVTIVASSFKGGLAAPLRNENRCFGGKVTIGLVRREPMVRCSIRRLGVGTACMVCLALCAAAGHAEDRNALPVLEEQYKALKAAGRYREAEPIARRMLEIADRDFKDRPKRVAHYLNTLAIVLQEQGRYAEAEPLYLRSLRIYETVEGPEGSNVAAVLNNIATLYRDQGIPGIEWVSNRGVRFLRYGRVFHEGGVERAVLAAGNRQDLGVMDAPWHRLSLVGPPFGRCPLASRA